MINEYGLDEEGEINFPMRTQAEWEAQWDEAVQTYIAMFGKQPNIIDPSAFILPWGFDFELGLECAVDPVPTSRSVVDRAAVGRIIAIWWRKAKMGVQRD